MCINRWDSWVRVSTLWESYKVDKSIFYYNRAVCMCMLYAITAYFTVDPGFDLQSSKLNIGKLTVKLYMVCFY